MSNLIDNSKEEELRTADIQSKQFLTNWLSNRKPILLNNIKTYDSANSVSNGIYSDERADGMLTYQLKAMNKATIGLSNELPSDLKGQFNKKTGCILINRNIRTKSNPGLMNATVTHERTHSLRPDPQEAEISSLVDKHLPFRSKDWNQYVNRSEEIYARLMAFRAKNNLDPKKVVTKEDLNKWRGQLMEDDLEEYPDDLVLDLFNKVAYNEIAKNKICIPTGLLYRNNIT